MVRNSSESRSRESSSRSAIERKHQARPRQTVGECLRRSDAVSGAKSSFVPQFKNLLGQFTRSLKISPADDHGQRAIAFENDRSFICRFRTSDLREKIPYPGAV